MGHWGSVPTEREQALAKVSMILEWVSHLEFGIRSFPRPRQGGNIQC